jgi:hypothetical protein
VTVVSRWIIELAFASSPQSGLTWFCFLFRSSNRTGRSPASGSRKETHAFVHGRLAVRCSNAPVSEAPFQFACDVTEEESMYSWLS